MKRILCLLSVIAGCVDHRPIRNGLLDETVYLDKDQLTGDGWLMKVTVVKASSPNVLGDYVFPGLESDTQYVKARFTEDALQLVDGRQLQSESGGDPNDDITETADRMVMEFAGQHVDIKLRESLDGERTNLLEENTEAPWQVRQKFKVDLEKTSLDPITLLAWYYGDFVHDCATPVSQTLVPYSYEYDEVDQHLTFVIEANYKLNVATLFGYCYDMVSLTHDTGTAAIQYRFSLLRREGSTYAPEVIPEKAAVNKKYGAFQVLNTFVDPHTGLMSARSLLQRWDPNRAEPVIFYFTEGFPPKFKDQYLRIADETNALLEQAGARLRFLFYDHDYDGQVRNLGDLRYSFVAWHQDIESTRGLLGYGPSSSDPRTGEVISATLNLYNIGYDWYRFLIQDYLEYAGGTPQEDPSVPWGETVCPQTGASVAPPPESRLRSTLFSEMRRTLEIPEPAPDENPADALLPDPLRGRAAFLADYHRVLPELRYADPLWNSYTWRPSGISAAQLVELKRDEREMRDLLEHIMMNENPFGPAGGYSHAGIARHNEFIEAFRDWRRTYSELERLEEMMLGKRNIYAFDELSALQAITRSARRCKAPAASGEDNYWQSDEEYSNGIIDKVVFKVAIHEFGHNLGLRHNFYGSADATHMRQGEVSSSVMDYVAPIDEAHTTGRGWGAYDEAAIKWIYGDEATRTAMMADDLLYCTDEHRMNSPLCRANDLGATPSQIVLNAIERYDWMYEIRNRRAFRTFWDTSTYIGSVYTSVFEPLRMWYLAIFDWGGGGVQDTLKRLDQVGGNPVLSEQQYNEKAADFYNDIIAANGLVMAFYDAVINQPAAFRNYQTEFDPYYGDILRMGIVIDKLFTTFAFMDFQEVWDYDPNIYTYISMFDAPFGERNYAVSQRVLDNMLGSNYDTFPWFRFLALEIFAYATNSNLINDTSLKNRIAIRRYENREVLEAELGPTVIDEATRLNNPSQVFFLEGEEYVYCFLDDRGWHLVASRSKSPVSYQFIREYNEALNGNASASLDNYGLKVLLAVYEYYNNFSGF